MVQVVPQMRQTTRAIANDRNQENTNISGLKPLFSTEHFEVEIMGRNVRIFMMEKLKTCKEIVQVLGTDSGPALWAGKVDRGQLFWTVVSFSGPLSGQWSEKWTRKTGPSH